MRKFLQVLGRGCVDIDRGIYCRRFLRRHPLRLRAR
jgi:hypothetical protein